MDTWFLLQQANGQRAKIKAYLSAGVYTPYTTSAAPNSWVLISGPDGAFIKIATVLTGDIHTICVVAA